MATIILLQDILAKRSKDEELLRYKSNLGKLNFKLGLIQREIQLTKTIIDLIEKELIIEVNKNEIP